MSAQTSYRPASFRLALATCAHLPGIYPDDAHLASSLKRLGVEPTSCIWNDPEVDWSSFDAVLMRTTWDYFQRYAEFLRWLDQLPIPIINDKSLLRWNSDKRYLLELGRRGVAVIPSHVASAQALPSLLAGMRGQDLVVKPLVSGGAWLTLRGVPGEADFDVAVAQLPPEIDYLVQAFVPEVASEGEWSLLFFDGQYSHSVLKRAAAGDFRVQTQFGGSVDTVEPEAAIIASAKRALAAVAAIGHADHAYARVDGVMVKGSFVVMELELIEPTLFLADRPEAAERFASNLHRRLSALHEPSGTARPIPATAR